MVDNLLETNMYRCLDYCSNCPFKDGGKAMNLSDGRVDEIKQRLLSSEYESFNCHKTVYNLDKDMNETDEQANKMCYGAYVFLNKSRKPNIQMRLAYALGVDDDGISLYLRGRKLIWWMNIHVDGKRIRKSTGTANRKKAIIVARNEKNRILSRNITKVEIDDSTGEFRSLLSSHKMTLIDFLELRNKYDKLPPASKGRLKRLEIENNVRDN